MLLIVINNKFSLIGGNIFLDVHCASKDLFEILKKMNALV